jgi:hypothetical protein
MTGVERPPGTGGGVSRADLRRLNLARIIVSERKLALLGNWRFDSEMAEHLV